VVSVSRDMPPRPPSRTDSYWRLSRAPRYSLLFALPLLALYEGLAALLSGAAGVRNGAEVLLNELLGVLVGPRAGLVVVGLVVLGCVVLAGIDLRRNRGGVRPRVFAWMLAESAALAVVCGFVVSAVTMRLLNAVGPRLAILVQSADAPQAALAWPTRLMLSLGAGLFEELVFRVLLVGALVLGLRRLAGFRPAVAGVIATVVGALVFSAAHYVGAFGDAFTVQSFVFRAIAGLFFSGLFVLRGFGIAAWTHALYDVMVLVVR
jgi:hypothetical protein